MENTISDIERVAGLNERDEWVVEGLLCELVRGGDGVDDSFVESVLSKIEEVELDGDILRRVSHQPVLQIARGSVMSGRKLSTQRKAKNVLLWPRLITALAASLAVIGGAWWLFSNYQDYQRTSQQVAHSKTKPSEMQVESSVKKDAAPKAPLVIPSKDRIAAVEQEDIIEGKPLLASTETPVPEKKIANKEEKKPVVRNRMIAYLTTTGAGVSVLRGGQKRTIAVAGRIYENDTIIVSLKGIATVKYYKEEKTSLTILPYSRLKLFAEDGAKRIKLERGIVGVTVARQSLGKPMILLTEHASIRVLGTELVLTAERDRTRLDVTKGEVKIIHLRTKAAKIVTARQTAIANGRGAAGDALAIERTKLEIAGFTLINADTDEPVERYDPIKYGSTVMAPGLPTRNLKIRVNTRPAIVGSVYVGYPAGERDGHFWEKLAKRPARKCRADSSYPYVFSISPEDEDDESFLRKYTIIAVSCRKPKAHGERSKPLQMHFTVK